MPDPAPADYAAAFDARCAAAEGPGTRRVDGLGIQRRVPVDGESRTELLVLDDRAFDVLADVLPLASAGTIRFHDAARRCAELIRQDRTWTPKPVTAMVVTYLRSLPDGSRLFATVDDDGMVRGTSGSRTFSSQAYVFFVNTDPGWRRRGLGLSMTAAALRSAVKSGATRASLDASGPGIPLHRRLGFTAVAQITQFNHSG